MTVIAPPEPPQPHDELEALIEEARRRARKRRLKYAAAALGALLVGGGVFAGLELRSGSGTGQAVPDGFTLVQARGPVSHAVLRDFPSRVQRIDLATGAERPVVTTREIWWDQKGGLVRNVYRQDGRATYDYVSDSCRASFGPQGQRQKFCIPPQPFFLEKLGYRWPLDPCCVVEAGRGTYAGHDVIWVEGLVNGRRPRDVERVGLDARTHRPVVYQQFFRNRIMSGYEISRVSELPAQSVSFVVPKGGAPRNYPSQSRTVTQKGLAAARGALGATPLWLGRSFLGRRLRAVKVGTDSVLTAAGHRAQPARFVRFGYGTFILEEYGSDRPFWYLEGPEAGVALLNRGGPMFLAREGVLVVASPVGAGFKLDKPAALELAKALRPIPAG